MSATELRRAPLVAAERSLMGWGRTRPSRASVFQPRSADDVLEVLGAGAGRRGGLIARGAGRSYGDAAQNAGGDVLDMTGLRRILSIDRERRLVTAEAGATVAELLTALAATGLMLPVVPGTRHVTLAGAIASDIHGKNHHRDGGMARHVASLSLCTPSGERLEVSPESDPELFYATLGGMGLTGVIVSATLRAEPLPACVADDADRTDGLEETLALMTADDPHRYSVAWLDLLAGGSKSGRAIVSRSDPVPAGARRCTCESRCSTCPGASRAPRCARRACGPSTRSGGALRRAASAGTSWRSRRTSSRSTCSASGTGSTDAAA
jgi:decaprenylphospho-beta-D-ribofuranose 2-oxidase